MKVDQSCLEMPGLRRTERYLQTSSHGLEQKPSLLPLQVIKPYLEIEPPEDRQVEAFLEVGGANKGSAKPFKLPQKLIYEGYFPSLMGPLPAVKKPVDLIDEEDCFLIPSLPEHGVNFSFRLASVRPEEVVSRF